MILKALRDGLRRVYAAPAVWVGALLLTFLLALPLGLVLRGMLAESLGSSLAADSAATGVDMDWWQEFSSGATGIGETFTTRIIGFNAVLSNISAVLDARPQALVVMAAAGAYLLLWLFLSGGILDRYARGRPTRTAAFFSACGVYFVRFLRLAIIAGVAYALLFVYVHSWLFDSFYPWAIHDWTVERTAFFLRFGLYVVFGVLVIAANLLFDYAKVRAVVEDRRSMVGAVIAAFRFVRRQPLQTAGLYLLDALLFVLVLAAYALVGPGAGSTGWSMWTGFIVSEAYLLLRLWVKLLFYASEVSLFQNLLAHAEYAAAPLPVWPESPAAEAITPAPAAEQK
jgi:hypothetical protein